MSANPILSGNSLIELGCYAGAGAITPFLTGLLVTVPDPQMLAVVVGGLTTVAYWYSGTYGTYNVQTTATVTAASMIGIVGYSVYIGNPASVTLALGAADFVLINAATILAFWIIPGLGTNSKRKQ